MVLLLETSSYSSNYILLEDGFSPSYNYSNTPWVCEISPGRFDDTLILTYVLLTS